MPNVDGQHARSASPLSRSRLGVVLAGAMVVATLAAGPSPVAASPAVAAPEPVVSPDQQPAADAVEVEVEQTVDVASTVTEADAEPEPDEEAPDYQPWTLAFGGDVHFEGFLARQLSGNPDGLLNPVAEMMAAADLAMVNLETAVTDRGQPVPKGFTFRTKPAALTALQGAGVDVVSIANNHGMDYGLDGLVDTLAAAEAVGMPMVGGGMTAAEAYAPFVTEIGGASFAVIGATQVLDNSLIDAWTAGVDKPGLASAKDRPAIAAAVRAAADAYDVVVVYLHWGVEGQVCPVERQMDLADELVAAGAAVVVGGHAHRVQGGGFKRDAVIHYGLGNFVFYTSGGPGTDSGVLMVEGLGDRVTGYQWVPARLVGGVATELANPDSAASAWNDLRDCTDLAEAPAGGRGVAAQPIVT